MLQNRRLQWSKPPKLNSPGAELYNCYEHAIHATIEGSGGVI
jgi:hypothetical protein